MGRTNVEDFVLMDTFLTRPFLSGYTSVTRPRTQEPLGALESTTRTTSSTCTLREGKNHFWRSWSNTKYSRTHLFQNWSLKYCTCLQRRRTYLSLSVKMPGGRAWSHLSRRRWFGVKQDKSLGSEEHLVRGLPLRMASTSASKVARPSSLNVCSFNRPTMILRELRIRRSQEPPWWDAPGALKSQVIFFCWRKVSIR